MALLSASRVESQLVTMKWLLGFESVLPAFEALREGWNTPRGLDMLRDRLRAVGWSPGLHATLGYGVRSAVMADATCQVNLKPFGAYNDTFNDLFGAVNKGTFKLAVKGQAMRSPVTGSDIFEIDKVGIYCRDTYDFNASWYTDMAIGLGVWSRDRCLSKAEMAAYIGSPPALRAARFPGFVPTKNVDFRRWQKARNEGGDFYVFSDILWVQPHIDHVPLD